MDTHPLAQIAIARRHPLAMAIGSIAGTVPVGVYYLGHCELTSWDPREDPRSLIAYAGLAFSLLTVTSWAANVFQAEGKVVTGIKAIGFTALVEALMMVSGSPYLSGWCLALLIAINAVANGCRIALRAAAHEESKIERSAVRQKKPRSAAKLTVVK